MWSEILQIITTLAVAVVAVWAIFCMKLAVEKAFDDDFEDADWWKQSQNED